jgi:NTP pyrophosphatase (non-canonical NTP hydrolase)
MISEKDINDMGYQEIIKQYSSDYDTNGLIYYMGLAAEAGEVLNDKVKSLKDGKIFSKDEIASELGDVLYYVASIASVNGISLNHCFESNLSKIKSRASRA